MDKKVVMAYECAEKMHEGAKRKSSEEPYFTHVRKVYEIVRKYCADSDVQCAALLHDVAEDTIMTIEEIKIIFGEKVAKIVTEVSTSKEDKKSLNWEERKKNTIASISKISKEAQLVEAADKVANAMDLEKLRGTDGRLSFSCFKEKRVEKQEWYYRSLYEAFLENGKSNDVKILAQELGNYIDIAFQRSYEEYKKAQDNTAHHMPLLFEVTGVSFASKEKWIEQMTDALTKKKLKVLPVQPAAIEKTKMTKEELATMIRRLKENPVDIILMDQAFLEERLQVLLQFEESKKDLSCISATIEKLNDAKSYEKELIDGVIAIHEENPNIPFIDDNKVKQYNDHLLGALDSLGETPHFTIYQDIINTDQIKNNVLNEVVTVVESIHENCKKKAAPTYRKVK